MDDKGRMEKEGRNEKCVWMTNERKNGFMNEKWKNDWWIG